MGRSKRESISIEEARELGLAHLSGKEFAVSASPSRRSVVVQNAMGHPTAFTRKSDGWHVNEYHGYMAGEFRRSSESVPYERWLASNRPHQFRSGS